MIFGVDAMNSLENRNQHGYSNYCKRGVDYSSSNIAKAMREDPIWKEPLAVKQAVQDQFPLIGNAAARLGKRNR